jgi:hypothetical protein
VAETTAPPIDDTADDVVGDDVPESFTTESSAESFTTATPR